MDGSAVDVAAAGAVDTSPPLVRLPLLGRMVEAPCTDEVFATLAEPPPPLLLAMREHAREVASRASAGDGASGEASAGAGAGTGSGHAGLPRHRVGWRSGHGLFPVRRWSRACSRADASRGYGVASPTCSSVLVLCCCVAVVNRCCVASLAAFRLPSPLARTPRLPPLAPGMD